MRLEQVVLHGPGEDDRVRFADGLTVFAGLGDQERVDLIDTVALALTSGLPNASVVFHDHAGRRVFADRTGATYAVSGAAAPGPERLLGQDAEAIVRLLVVTAEELGLGAESSAEEIQAQLDAAQLELERARSEHESLREQTDLVATWQEELEVLNRRILQAQDHAARWAWVQASQRLAQLRAELAVLGEDGAEDQDRLVLEAVDALRTLGEAWADAAAAAAEVRTAIHDELGTIPEVEPDHLARVAATPDGPPRELGEALALWKAAAELRDETADALERADAAPPEADDPLVVAFAQCDQRRLWLAHAQLEAANATYAQTTASTSSGSLDPETEEAIEAAHREVVRRQRDVERRFRPGALGSGSLAVTALLAGQAVSILVGIVLLLAAVGLGVWLLAIPRRNLAQAVLLEELALTRSDAGSWLGLHLRRVDAFTDAGERRRFEMAANARTAAEVDWSDVAGTLSPEDLASRAEAVRAYVQATDPDSIARRRDDLETALANATRAEAQARSTLLGDLDPYGIVPGHLAGQDLRRLPALVDQRVAAGRVARRLVELGELEHKEAKAAARLGELLAHLGHADGPLEARLGRVIEAIAEARNRSGSGERPRATVQAEIAEVEAFLAAEWREGWADTPHPTAPPADPDLLDARRRDINETLNVAGRLDVVGAEHRHELAKAAVADLERRLEELASGPGSIQQRLIARLNRTVVLDGQEDVLPVFLDDPLNAVPVAERMDLLDLIVRIAGHVQVVFLTADPVVARWAQDRSRTADVALYEAQRDPAPARAEKHVAAPLSPDPIPVPNPILVEIY
ncbi:MAG: hypothetical protein KF703_00165 [Actinobacteria bacterium]|nr:hypothetical protein [Actinomycetota bacterium]